MCIDCGREKALEPLGTGERMRAAELQNELYDKGVLCADCYRRRMYGQEYLDKILDGTA